MIPFTPKPLASASAMNRTPAPSPDIAQRDLPTLTRLATWYTTPVTVARDGHPEGSSITTPPAGHRQRVFEMAKAVD
ncbi:MAG: hypothetical protein H6705_04385 [Myxococcales bacterium]|nr:hypothetical protein [Myxococcales bacterium]